MKNVVTRTRITCPECGTSVEEEMPANACLHFYSCAGCGAMLTPLAGDCCVFCSYGEHPCPPRQVDPTSPC